MHRSRLAAVLIDCEGGDLQESADFWAEVFGRRVCPQEDPRYMDLSSSFGGGGGIKIGLQAVARGEAGVHIDIETDDVAAEVARLEKLGARKKRVLKGWVVMEAPSGHAFCVVPAGYEDFPDDAKVWE